MNAEEREELAVRIGNDPALWRAEAWAAYAQVDDEFQRARKRPLPLGDPRANEIEIVQDDLDDALLAMAPPDWPSASGASAIFQPFVRGWKSLKLYYSGSDIERTWSGIHRASAALFMLYDENELPALAARLNELVTALPDLSSQVATLRETRKKLEESEQGQPIARASLRELYQEAMDATESLQTEARALRNTLLAASGALFLVVFALGIVHLFNDSVLSLCTTVEEGSTVCPAGESSHPFDVFGIELAGMLGGILSVVIPLATGERIKTPYRVFNHQMLLKVLAGAATGLAGVALVDSGFVSVLTVTSSTTIIGYAIFFGFSQQALTGVIDRRADKLGKETPTARSV